MKNHLKMNTVLAVLISSISFQSCTPQANITPSTSPSVVPSASETVKPVESVAPTASTTPTTNPSVDATPTPIATPVVSATPSVVPSVIPTVAPSSQAKTYVAQMALNSGRGTAYITLNSETSGKVLVNFQDINDAPTKINLLDQNGNNILSSNSFSVAMSGNFSSTFSKQPQQLIKKIQLFFANGRMVENIIDDTILSTLPEATPIPPNPTPVKTPELPTIYPHTYIPADFKVTTFAGSGTYGYLDATGTSAEFRNPYGIAVDSSGNIFVADKDNHRIRKITPAGVVTTLAGSTQGYTDATGTSAKFNYPYGVAVDGSGNVFVADTYGNKIRKITPAGVVTTLAGSSYGHTDATGAAAQFRNPYGVAVDSSGNVFVADRWNQAIRKIDTNGAVTTIAGSSTDVTGYVDATGTSARFDSPTGVAVDNNGNVFVADRGNSKIRKITSAGVVTTIAGSSSGFVNGVGAAAQFSNPFGVALDNSGNLYIADRSNEAIRKITPAGVVTKIAGGTNGYLDGFGSNAQFNGVYGVAIDTSGSIYVADAWNNRIRKIR